MSTPVYSSQLFSTDHTAFRIVAITLTSVMVFIMMIVVTVMARRMSNMSATKTFIAMLIVLGAVVMTTITFSFNMQYKYAIATTVFLVVSLMAATSAAWYVAKGGSALSALGSASFLNMLVLLLLLASPARSGAGAVVTQSVLFVPYFVATLAALGYAGWSYSSLTDRVSAY